jgi:hypothetical protein
MDLFCMWGDKCRAIDFVHPPIHSTLYVYVTCSLASPSKFNQPKPNRWCTHFVVSMVSETGGHKEGRRLQEMISDIISCLQHIFSIQYNWHIRFQLMYFTVSMWFLNFFTLSVQVRNIHNTYKSEYVLPSVRNNQTGYKRERQRIYGTT